jgi:hypothetical protein
MQPRLEPVRPAAAAGVVQAGDAVSNATLYLSNVTLLWNITPERADGKGTPGVEFSKATYQLVGDVVATADLADKASWKAVKPEEVRRGGGTRAGWCCCCCGQQVPQ